MYNSIKVGNSNYHTVHVGINRLEIKKKKKNSDL